MPKRLITEFCTWLDKEGYTLQERPEHFEMHRRDSTIGKLREVDNVYMQELINRFIVSELPYVS